MVKCKATLAFLPTDHEVGIVQMVKCKATSACLLTKHPVGIDQGHDDQVGSLRDAGAEQLLPVDAWGQKTDSCNGERKSLL